MRYLHSGFIVLLLAALLASGCSKQSKASRHLERAQKYFAAGDYDKAEIEFQNTLRLSPTNQLAIRGLSQIYFEDEHLLASISYLNSVKKHNPNDLESRARTAQAYFNAGAVKEARDEAIFVLERSPTNEMAMLVFIESAQQSNDVKSAMLRISQWQQKTGDHSVYHSALGFLAARSKDAPTAEAEFKKALQLDPKSATAHWGLANLYATQNKIGPAESELKSAFDLSPIRSIRRTRYIEFKYRNGATNEAMAMIKDINAKAPDYLPAWIFKARVALGEKKIPEALDAIDKVLLRNPDHFDALILRADARVMEKKFSDALADLERVSALAPKSALIRYRIASVQVAKQETEKAITSLTQALALDPRHTPSILLLAELNTRRGQTLSAVSALNDLLKREPKLIQAHFLVASAYQANNRLDDALAAYQKILSLDPKNREAALSGGLILRQMRRPDEARKIFEALLQSKPDDNRALQQLVDMDIEIKDFASAERRVQAEITRRPKDPIPLFLMANIRRSQKNSKETVEYLEKVIELDPEMVNAYVLLARIYIESGELKTALEKIQTILKTKPNDSRSLLSLALIYHQSKDYTNARDAYEKVLTITPNSAGVLNNLANLYADNFGQLDRAYDLARKAEEIRPKDPGIADTFGWILARRGEYALALNLLRESVRNIPTDMEVTSHLGLTYYLSGDEASAREILERLLSQQAEFPLRAEAQKSLEILKIDPTKADQKARAALEQRLAEKPADVVALSRMSVILAKENATDKSIALHEKAIAANPKLPSAMARLAALYSKAGKNSSRALEMAREARNLAPEDPEVAQNAARAAMDSNNLKDQQWGLSLLQDSSVRRRGDAETLLDLAHAYFAQGRVNEAEVTIKEALRANPNFETAAANRLADSASLVNDPARAAQSTAKIQELLKVDPGYIPAVAALAVAQQQAGNAAAAIASYEKVLARYPGFTPAIRNLALITADRPNDPKAIEYLAKAREAFPSDPQISKLFGIVAYNKADYQRSVATFGDLAKKNTNDAQVQFYLGMSLFQLKSNQPAKAALQRAINIDPNAPFVSEAKKVLPQLK